LRVVLDMRTETYRVLDDAGSALWSVLIGETVAEEAFGDLRRRYDVDEQRLHAELVAFADRCVGEGLLACATPGRDAGPEPPPRARPRVIRPRVLRALLFAIGTERALARDGFRATHARYARLPLGPDVASVETALAAFVRAENFFMVRGVRGDCLPRSLALYRFLRSASIAAEHVIGVRRFPFNAHAWVECAGALVLEPPLDGYTALTRIGDPATALR
jgi:hypothetical protein